MEHVESIMNPIREALQSALVLIAVSISPKPASLGVLAPLIHKFFQLSTAREFEQNSMKNHTSDLTLLTCPLRLGAPEKRAYAQKAAEECLL